MAEIPLKYTRVNSASVSSDPIVRVTEYGGNVQSSRKKNGQRWTVEFEIKNLTDFELAELTTILQSLNGRENTFLMRNPKKVYGADSLNFAVNAHASQGNSSVAIKGLTPNKVDRLVVGDFIMFNNHTKVYRVAESVTSNASGYGTLKIFPPLFQSVPTNTTAGEAIFTLRLKSNIITEDIKGNSRHHPFVISAKEDWQ